MFDIKPVIMIPVTVRYKLESVATLRSLQGIPYLLNITIFSIFDSNFLDDMILIIPYSRDLMIPRIFKLHLIIKVSIIKSRLEGRAIKGLVVCNS